MSISVRAKWIPRILASNIAIICTFGIIGAWHGDSLHWFLYGCYHGVGLAAFQLYNYFLKLVAPDRGPRMQDNKFYRFASMLLTFNFVTWGLLLTIPPVQLKEILSPEVAAAVSVEHEISLAERGFSVTGGTAQVDGADIIVEPAAGDTCLIMLCGDAAWGSKYRSCDSGTHADPSCNLRVCS